MRKIPTRKSYVDRSEAFDEFLEKDGLLAETEDAAIKQIIADQIRAAMDKQRVSKTAMAARMKTSRRQLDPGNPSVTLAALRRAQWGEGSGWGWSESVLASLPRPCEPGYRDPNLPWKRNVPNSPRNK